MPTVDWLHEVLEELTGLGGQTGLPRAARGSEGVFVKDTALGGGIVGDVYIAATIVALYVVTAVRSNDTIC